MRISTMATPHNICFLSLFFAVLFFHSPVSSQSNPYMYGDSTYHILNRNFYKTPTLDSVTLHSQITNYLQLAKQKDDPYNTSLAYLLIGKLHATHPPMQLTYIDSAIAARKRVIPNTKLEAFYTDKGLIEERRGNFKKALQHYLEALSEAKKSNNTNYQFISKLNIGLLKRKLGRYTEAKVLFKECLAYEESFTNKTHGDSISYLGTLSELVAAYRLNKELDSAKIYNDIGLQWIKNKPNAYIVKLNKGILAFYDQRYTEAKATLERILPDFLKKESQAYYDYYNLIDAYYYLGETHNQLGEKETALKYYKKIDSLSEHMQYIIPRNREAYLRIINYYKTTNNPAQQLAYTNKLITVDSILTANYKFISDKFTQHDKKELLADSKQQLETVESFNTRYKYFIILLGCVSLGIIVLLIRQYKKRKLYEQKFDVLMQKQQEAATTAASNTVTEAATPTQPTAEAIGISEELVEKLVSQFDKFEHKRGFTRKNITTSSLAKEFHTNSKYVSKVIHHHKNKSFTEYINDLRIDYAMQQLALDSKFKNYTVRAIADEIGFSNPQSFSNYFYKKNGIYPSFYIKKIKQQPQVQQDPNN